MNRSNHRLARRRHTSAKRHRKLLFEQFESRRVLAISTWTGGGADDLWSNPANWDAVPVDGSDVRIAATSNSAEVLFDTSVAGTGVTINSLTSDGVNPVGEPLRITGDTLTLFGAGPFALGAGVTIASGTLSAANAVSIDALTFSGGILSGTGHVTIVGAMTWTDGDMIGPGQTTTNGSLAIAANNGPDLDGRTLNINGNTILTGTSNWRGINGAVVNNAGLFDVQSDAVFHHVGSVGSVPAFNNLATGTFRKSSGTGVNDVEFAFNNSGAVEASAGTLSLNRGGTSTGTFTTTATLAFGGGTHDINANISGAGTVQFRIQPGISAGTTHFNGGTYNVTGSTQATAGFANFNAGVNVLAVGATLSVSNSFGNLNFSSGEAIQVTTLNMSSGRLSGSDNVTISGLTTWTGGIMSGSGQTTTTGSLAITANNGPELEGRTLNINGGATVTAAGGAPNFRANNGAVINNNAGPGVAFDVQSDATLLHASASGANGAIPTFNNTGTFQKSGGTGVSNVDFAFNSSSAVQANAGTLSLNAGGTSTGSFTTSATLAFGGGTHDINANISGAGTVRFSGGTTNLNGGTYNVTAGTQATGGTTNFNAGVNLVNVGAALTMTASFGNLNFNSGEAVNATTFNMSAGTFSGSDNVTISGASTWTGGVMRGSGLTTMNGSLAITAENFAELDGRTLNMNGGATLTGTSFFRAVNGAVFNNAGLFDVQSDALFHNVGASTPTPIFNNLATGTFRKSAGAGITNVEFVFNNSGVVELNAGTFSPNRGGTSTGDWALAATGELRFTAGTYLLDNGTDITGAGVATIAGGTVNIGDAAVDVVNAANFALNSGTLQGAGNLITSGLFIWPGGTMSGSGQTTTNGSLAITAGNNPVLDTRTLNINGGATLTGDPDLRGLNGAVINNASLFDFQSNADFRHLGGTAPIFNNLAAGTMRKSAGTGVSSSGFMVNNNGVIEVNTGTLSLDAGGTSTGNFTVAGTLGFGGGTHNLNLNAGNSISGAGTVQFSGGTTNLSGGTYNITGGTRSTGGTAANFNAGINVVAVGSALTVSGGNLNFSSGEAINATTLSMSGGILSGSDTVTISGASTWTGGTMGGSGQTTTNDSLAINANNNPVLDTRTLNVNGGATLTGDPDLRGLNGGVINNASLFDVQSDADFRNLGGATTFNNLAAGTLRKSAGTGVSSSGFVFNNSGAVEVNTGTLLPNAGGTSTGDWAIAATGELRFTAGTAYLLDHGTDITGAGTVILTANGTVNVGDSATDVVNIANLVNGFNFSAGTLNVVGTLNVSGVLKLGVGNVGGTISGAGDVNIAGLLTWQSGEMSGSGRTFANGGISFNVAGGGLTLTGRRLDNTGTATWTSPLTQPITFREGAVFNNHGLFDAQDNSTITNGSGAASAFNNFGTFRKSGGTGSAVITNVNVPFNNTGAVEVQVGTARFGLGGASTGSWVAAAPATLQFGGGTHNLNAGSGVTGAGTVLVSNGTLNSASTYNVANTQVTAGTADFSAAANTGTLDLGANNSAGTLRGSADVTVSGLTRWFSGTMTGSGKTLANGGMTFIIDGGGASLDGRRLDSAGTGTWTSPLNQPIVFSNGAVLNNNGVLDAQDNSRIAAGVGAASSFNNNGTFRKSAGTGTTTIGVPFTNNGTIDAQTGTVSLTGGLTNYSAATPPTTLTGGTYLVAGTFQFTGGDIVTSAATIVLNGAASSFTNINSLGANAATGNFTIQNGRNFTSLAGLSNAGSVTIGSGSTFLTAAGDYTQTGGTTTVQGTLDPAGDAIIQGGTLAGTGNVLSNTINAGTVTPGTSPGVLTVNGDYSQAVAGALNIEIAGTNPATPDFDQLTVTGAATLGGMLHISLLSGFVPVLGAVFPIIPNSTSQTGTFSTVNGSQINVSGLFFDVDYRANGFDVAVDQLNAGNDAAANEGQTFNLLSTFSDPGANDDYTATVNWGDGSPVQPLTVNNVANTISGTHAFGDNGVFNVTVTLLGADGSTASDSMVVSVSNVNPTLIVPAIPPTPEGATITLSPTFTDPGFGTSAGAVETFTFSINWGDGSAPTAGSGTINTPGSLAVLTQGSFSDTHTYADDGVYTVTVTVNDDDSGSDVETLTVTVSNVAPTLTVAGNQTRNEGQLLTVTDMGVFTDPGFNNPANPGAEKTETFTATINWGDGTAIDNTAVTIDVTGSPDVLTQGSFDGSHTYADDGVYTVTVTVTDDDSGSDIETFTVTVSNVAPTLTVAGNQVVNEASPLNIVNIGSFSDPGFNNLLNPGAEAQETFTATINWGDGTPVDNATITIDQAGGPGVLTAGSFDGLHTYADNGVFTVTVTVNDDDGGSDSETFQVTVNNVAPDADAGGPYTVNEGAAVQLSGFGADVAGVADPLTFSWDLDSDGVFGETGAAAANGDEVGANPALNAANVDGLAAGTPIVVAIRVNDGDGGITTDTATVTVNNVAPVASSGGPYTVNAGATVQLAGSGIDPAGALDPLTFVWDLDNDGNFGETGGLATRGDETGAVPTFNSAGLAGGTQFTVVLRVSDGDGGQDDDTALINVINVGIPTFTINDVQAAETNAGTTNAVFTVTLSQNPTQQATVRIDTADNTATLADNDYNAVSGLILTFNPGGALTQTVTVQVRGDTKFEADQTYFVNLSSATGGSQIGDSQGIGTITNDDVRPTITIAGASANEGDALTFNLTLSNPSDEVVTVLATVNDAEATVADNDYTDINNQLISFAAGVTSQPFVVQTTEDAKFETDQTFFVNLSNPTNATFAVNQGLGTIQNDDSRPTISISGNPSQLEGDTGSFADVPFTVSLSNASDETVSVRVDTADDTASDLSGDYNAVVNRIITFSAGGPLTQQTAVRVNGDVVPENNETFTVGLSNPTNGTLGTSTAAGAILDDDSAPRLSIDDVALAEGDGGAKQFVFTVTLLGAIGQPVTVQVASQDGTATDADNDYEPLTPQTLTFTVGGPTTQSVTVLVNGDTRFELDQTFTVTLANATNAVITDDTGLGTIVNDDGRPTITIAAAAASEGDTLTFHLTLSNASDEGVTVLASTNDGTATTADSDYAAITNQPVNFAAGATTAQFTVPSTEDTKFEADQTFTVVLNGAVNATAVSGSPATGTILNDDTRPTLTINDRSVVETNASFFDVQFSIALSNPSDETVTVRVDTANGTATTADNDYVQVANRTVTFNPGSTLQQTAVGINGDAQLESDETYFVNLSFATGASGIVDNQGLGTILNDDAASPLNQPPVISSNGGGDTGAVSVAENSTVVTDVNATDPDLPPQTLTFSIAGGADAARFSINGASGVLTFATAPNFESPTDAGGNNVYDVIVQVSDGSLTDTQTIAIAVNNVNEAPTLDPIANPMAILQDTGLQTINLTGISAGAGESQILTVTATSSNPDLVPNPTVAYANPNATGSLSYTIVANQSGTAIISVTVRDDGGSANGGVDTVIRTFTVTVLAGSETGFDLSIPNRATIVADPANPGRKVLLTVGGSANDALIIEPRPSNRVQIRVKQTGKLLGLFPSGAFGRIVAFGLGGNDTILIDSRIAKSVELHGGTGNDSLFAGAGHDALFGEDGNDQLYGRSGNDKLSGGEGNDNLYGGNGNDRLLGESGDDNLFGEAGNDLLLAGLGGDRLYSGAGKDILIGGGNVDRLLGQGQDDLLIGGSTTHDNNDAALNAIMAEWSASRSFNARINNLRSRLNVTTVLDDAARDELRGDGGQDWYLDFVLADTIVGFSGSSPKPDRKN